MVLLSGGRSDKLLRMLRGSSRGLLVKATLAREYRREALRRGMVKSRGWTSTDGDDVEGRPRKMIQTSGVYMVMKMVQLVMLSVCSTRPVMVVSGPMAWHMPN